MRLLLPASQVVMAAMTPPMAIGHLDDDAADSYHQYEMMWAMEPKPWKSPGYGT